MKKRRYHPREFKLQAVQMVLREKRPIVEVADELGISEVLLGRWKKEYQGDPESFNRATKLHPAEIELRKMKRENELLKEEARVLKKAITYFKEFEQ